MPNYTDLLNLFMPVVGGDYGVWGNFLNESIKLLDESVVSSNFAQDSGLHSGLNFYYKSGRIIHQNSLVEVSSGSVLLSDSAINYVEVSMTGSVSANTVGFTIGSIPLFQVETAGGSINTISDKRAYMQANHESPTGSTIIADNDGNVLVNGAVAETTAEKSWSLKQGVDPTTSTADQITIFATQGANSTLGLRTEQAIDNNLLRTKINGEDRYLYTREVNSNPVSGFISSNVTVTNTTTETTLMQMTMPGKNSPSGQFIKGNLIGFLSTSGPTQVCTITFYIGLDTITIPNVTGATYTNDHFTFYFMLFVKGTAEYSASVFPNYGGEYSAQVVDFTDNFQTDTILKATATWTVASTSNILNAVGGCYEVKS